MERVILHSDLNNCYASIECMLHPELRGKYIAVCAALRNGMASYWPKTSSQSNVESRPVMSSGKPVKSVRSSQLFRRTWIST